VSRLVLVGPQKGRPTAGAILTQLGASGRIATITAGWQEWEADDADLTAQLGPGAVNLRLYARAEAVWAADPALRSAHRGLQDRLRHLRRLYNRRLEHLATDWLDLLEDDGPDDLLVPEREHALSGIQALDAHHLARIRDMEAEFDAEFAPLDHDAVLEEQAAIREVLRACDAVVIEGGHVALIRNRMQMFGLRDLIEDRTVVACSGAAMALGPRIVLFHDSPPSGPGHTEVALAGLDMYSGLIPLPHARTRLRLGDVGRVARLSARFAPDRCVILEAGTRVDWDGSEWTPVEAAALDATGSIGEWKAVA
jgi:hypothetical protein